MRLTIEVNLDPELVNKTVGAAAIGDGTLLKRLAELFLLLKQIGVIK